MQTPFIDVDERLDTVPATNFSLIQKIGGTAFAIDTLLLANFIKFNSDMRFAADLGSGSGILSFLIKYRCEFLNVTGFEMQKELSDLAERNLEMNRRLFSGVSFENMDIRDIPSRILPESFDLVASNPPYFKADSGRLPPDALRAYARHELNGALKDFVEASSYMLSYGGHFCVVVPSGRFYEIAGYLKTNNFGLKRLQFIMPKEGENSYLALIDAEKFYNGKHEALNNIAVHMADNSFSPYLQRLFLAGLEVFKR